MPVIYRSLPALLQARADQRPDAIAFTRIGDEPGPVGFAESLPYRPARIVAEELSLRVADLVLAPTGSIPVATNGRFRRPARVERRRSANRSDVSV